ncbi:MAG: hypothetical protein V3W41_07505, partial [Planctomycetota bacterium]
MRPKDAFVFPPREHIVGPGRCVDFTRSVPINAIFLPGSDLDHTPAPVYHSNVTHRVHRCTRRTFLCRIATGRVPSQLGRGLGIDLGHGATQRIGDPDIGKFDLIFARFPAIIVPISAISVSHISVSHISISHISVSHISISHISISHISISHISIPYIPIPYIPISYIPISYIPISYIPISYIPISHISISYISISHIS